MSTDEHLKVAADPNRLEFVASFYRDSLTRDRGEFVDDLKRAAETLARIAGQTEMFRMFVGKEK